MQQPGWCTPPSGVPQGRDEYGALCHDIAVKHEAGNDIALEIIEARQRLESLAGSAGS